MFDLHMHSEASDGSQTPGQIVRSCRDVGLELCAITDHDNIDAQREAMFVSREMGQPYVPGVEISVIHTGELHILGYGMDLGNETFVKAMEDLRQSRIHRIECILASLREHGIDVGMDQVRHFAKGNTLGRVHVALALVEAGHAGSFAEAFSTYLNEGGLCYVTRRKLTAEEAISLIVGAGGIAVLAHPGLVHTQDLSSLVNRLVAAGLRGIEAYYPLHSDGDVQRFEQMAIDRGLLVTSGSDSHGQYRDAAIGQEKRSSIYLRESLAILRSELHIDRPQPSKAGNDC